MARPRTPTNVLDARGAFKVHPERRREDAEASGPLTDPPDTLTPEQLQCWREVVRTAPVGAVTESDRMALELLACLFAEFRLLRSEFPANKLGRLEALLGRFGMTPADRSKVAAPSKKPTSNPFASLD